MLTNRVFALVLAGGLLAAPAAFASDDQDYDMGEALAWQCQSMADTFDKAVASAPDSTIVAQAKALRADAAADCFGMSSSVDNVSSGLSKISAALEMIGVHMQEPTPPPSALTPGG